MIWFYIYLVITLGMLVLNLPTIVHSITPVRICLIVSIIIWPVFLVICAIVGLINALWVHPGLIWLRIKHSFQKWWNNEY